MLGSLLLVSSLPEARLEAIRPWFTSGLERLLDEGAVATDWSRASPVLGVTMPQATGTPIELTGPLAPVSR